MSQSKRQLPNVVFLIAGLVFVAVAVVLGWMVLQPSTPRAVSDSALGAAQNDPNIPFPQVPRIELADAKARFDAKSAIFVDVRGREVYAAAHIPGALSIPLSELEARYAELPRDQDIITYCT